MLFHSWLRLARVLALFGSRLLRGRWRSRTRLGPRLRVLLGARFPSRSVPASAAAALIPLAAMLCSSGRNGKCQCTCEPECHEN
ncbi:MAG TPA: hypothetical protein VLV86_06260 [Vicinamibacterales bacterium]|nr:hypothetical protein [Vicinamibacterales bacterium]